MGLARARIEFVTRLGAGLPEHIDVKFNPTEYSLVRNMNYADVAIPGLASPLVQFVRGETQTLSLELYLDNSDRLHDAERIASATASQGSTTAGGSSTQTPTYKGVEAELALLRLLVTIDSGLHAPPVVAFKWGNLEFRGVVATFSEKFQMFDENGYALRARVTLSLKRYETPRIQARQLSLESPDRTKTRVVREGERIDVIALEEYGDSAHWRTIASANRLARPRVLQTGTVLIIPPL